MKAGILTFHDADNYGAVLQAYALTQWLKQNNVDAEIVNYQSKIYRKYKTFRKHLYKRAPYILGVDIIKYRNKNRRNKNFASFRKSYLPTSKEMYCKKEDFNGITDKYDYFICGSDQIWNPEITKGFDPVYFLDFVKSPEKKIAYAPSVALKKLTEFQIADISDYTSSFASLAIREQEAIDILQPYCEKDINKTCDPVFLPDRSCYDNICSKTYEGKKYVFLYVVGRAVKFKKVISYAEKTAKEKGLELYYIIDGDKALYHIDGKNVFGCNPKDFLSLIKNAQCVVSNSFHATAFSILFAKQFITFLKDGTGSRMVNLLRAFNLENRIFDEDKTDMFKNQIDYSSLEKSLNEFRVDSVEYLCNALGLKETEQKITDNEIISQRQKNRKELKEFVEWRKNAYLVRHRDEHTLAKSRSGGIFTAVSDAILAEGGVVYGCAMEGTTTAVHQRATTKEERDLFRGSKYIQSEMRDCFTQVKKDLKDGLTVLFSGTSCQIAGLLGYLHGEDTSKLYTMDIICHGTPSPKLWREYLNWMKEKYGKEITAVNFRNKRYGWKAHYETVKMGKAAHTTSTFRILFFRNAFLRPACYECPFSKLNRLSDITIGDAWGIQKSKSKFNDNKGCSIVLLNSEKAEKIFKSVKNDLNIENVDLRDFMQHNLYQPSIKPENRQKFWDCLDKQGFDAVADKYGRARLPRRIADKFFILSKNLRRSESDS